MRRRASAERRAARRPPATWPSAGEQRLEARALQLRPRHHQHANHAARAPPPALDLANEPLDHVRRHGDPEPSHDHRVDARRPVPRRRPAGRRSCLARAGCRPGAIRPGLARRSAPDARCPARPRRPRRADGPRATTSSPARRPRASARSAATWSSPAQGERGEVPARVARDDARAVAPARPAARSRLAVAGRDVRVGDDEPAPEPDDACAGAPRRRRARAPSPAGGGSATSPSAVLDRRHAPSSDSAAGTRPLPHRHRQPLRPPAARDAERDRGCRSGRRRARRARRPGRSRGGRRGRAGCRR